MEHGGFPWRVPSFHKQKDPRYEQRQFCGGPKFRHCGATGLAQGQSNSKGAHTVDAINPVVPIILEYAIFPVV